MNSFLRRERRRFLEGLIDLQYLDDLRNERDDILYDRRRFAPIQFDSDDDDHYEDQKNITCLMTLRYLGLKRKHNFLDEIIIVQNNRVVFMGCLKNSDKLTIKLKRSQNQSSMKLKFYINDALEDKVASCCEHGLAKQNQKAVLFQINHIFGSKPCHKCRGSYDSTKLSYSHSNSSSIDHQVIENTVSSTESPKVDKASMVEQGFSSKTPNHNKTRTGCFTVNVSDHITSNGGIKDCSSDHMTSMDPDSDYPQQKRYLHGPPQLSASLSLTDSMNSSIIDRNQPLVEDLFNSASPMYNRQNSGDTIVSENRESAYRESSTDAAFLQSSVTNASEHSDEQVKASDNSHLIDDVTQAILSRLGITREQGDGQTVAPSIPVFREKGNVEYFTMIYLHPEHPTRTIINNLRSLVNFLKVFDDTDDCIAFMNTVVKESIILIISHSFYKSIVSRIRSIPQIFMVYILCEHENDIDLSCKVDKVQGIYVHLHELCEQIANDIYLTARDLINYASISSTSTELHSVYVYSKLLNGIILDNAQIPNNLSELVKFARLEYDGNETELNIIDDFERNYQKTQAIYWYSKGCFLSKMINKALRTPDADVVFKLRLFLKDLYEQIEMESIKESITVYLAQTMRQTNLDDLKNNILRDDIMTFSEILSASTDRAQTIESARNLSKYFSGFIPCIISIDIPAGSKFATQYSNLYKKDDINNILLKMGCMGRIINVQQENTTEAGIASIHLRLVNEENEENIQRLINIERMKIGADLELATLTRLIINMNEQVVAERILKSIESDENYKSDFGFQIQLGASLNQLAFSYKQNSNYEKAVELFHIVLNVFLRVLPADYAALDSLYTNIGLMYTYLNDYDKSYEYFRKAIISKTNSDPPDLFGISNCTSNIGVMLLKQNKHYDSIKYFERTLRILEQVTEPHDQELAVTYENIGDAWLATDKVEQALKFYKQAIETYEQHVTNKDPEGIGSLYFKVGTLYSRLGLSNQASINLLRALEYFQQCLPLTNSIFPVLYNNIGLAHYREIKYEDALGFYKKSLEFASMSLPENHSLIGIVYFNMALAYSNTQKLDDAVEYVEKSTMQFLKTLPPDHSHIVDNAKYLQILNAKRFLKDILDDDTEVF